MWAIEAGDRAVGVLEHSIRRAAPNVSTARLRAGGKFLYAGDEKIYLRGVTYGTFRPGPPGAEYDPAAVERDFAGMTANGFNAVRVYTVPPRWLLDAAQRHGLRVMVGLPWEQHVAFLAEPDGRQAIEERVRSGVRACSGHPAVLCYAVGNEIPASIVRWYGARRVERFLARLCRAVKAEDRGALVTYVNFPSTEYLCLDFVDVVCFNVYLESPELLERYLARLHLLAGDRPLLLAEIGLDSRRHGEDAQATAIAWQVRTAFAGGCAGAFVFAWTDEWHRGGYDVEDWNFGLTTRDRRPKPALGAARDAFAAAPFPRDLTWPRVSVVVCTHNGARAIGDCLDGLLRLDYPDYEVIVVDDGSTDATAEIVSEYDVQLIRTPNRGLSSARNTGMETATGEIVAYIDDDAYPDPHWLTYLAATFVTTDHAGVGGPNIAPPGDGPIAACVANAPGNPVQVLLTDQVAEHIAGCNSAFRRSALRQIGGFDPRFRVAGDDVDICWRLHEQGWTLGFSPAAMVWHHRRNSIRAFWRQQVGYGRAEALLEAKWPAKYNAAGHLTWSGRLYGDGLTTALGGRRRIYHGAWGNSLFQSVYQPSSGFLWSLPLMPEWFLVILALTVTSLLGFVWRPLLLATPVLFAAVGAVLVQAGLSGARARFPDAPRGWIGAMKLHALTAALHVVQPLARLRGRQRHGLTPWRHRGAARFALPCPRSVAIWSEHWLAPSAWLEAVEATLRGEGAVVLRGGSFDRWDLTCRGGLLGASRLLLMVEEHGNGRQYARFRWWPRCSGWSLVTSALLGVLAILSFAESMAASSILGLGACVCVGRMFAECARATAAFLRATAAFEHTSRHPASVVAELPRVAVAIEPAD